MPTATIRRKITKGRVVRTPDGFEVGQSVHFAAVTPRTWIMTLEPHGGGRASGRRASWPSQIALECGYGPRSRRRARRRSTASNSRSG